MIKHPMAVLDTTTVLLGVSNVSRNGRNYSIWTTDRNRKRVIRGLGTRVTPTKCSAFMALESQNPK